MNSELKAKLEARRSKVDDKGEKFENVPTAGVCDRAASDNQMRAVANEFVPNAESKRDSSNVDGRSSKGTLIDRAKLGIEKKQTQGEISLDPNGTAVHWSPLMQIPLPHCLTSSEFGLCGSQKGWQLRLYPRGPKASGDKSTISLTAPKPLVVLRLSVETRCKCLKTGQER